MEAGMLSWPEGPRLSDGIWGRFWYDNVWQSTGFQPYRSRVAEYDLRFQPVVDDAQPIYRALWEHRIK